MILARALYRLYLVGAALGLWAAPDPGAAPPAPGAAGWAPCFGGGRCGVALVQGRRFAQEDRTVALAGRLAAPAPPGGSSGVHGTHWTDAIYAGVYDGHEGPAASDFLARGLHARLLPLAAAAWRREPSLAAPALAAALAGACLDANRQLTGRLARVREDAGSTAVFALLVGGGSGSSSGGGGGGGQVLVGNVGNSRALICRRAPAPPGGTAAAAAAAAPGLAPLLLTSDHVPSRADEAARVASAGGAVARSARGGKLRLDGDLEVTRAFGDLEFQTRGLTAEPEFAARDLEPGRDALLILTSDGVSEVMAPEQVCAHAWAEWQGDDRAAPRAPPPAPAIALGPVPGGGGGGGGGEGAGAAAGTGVPPRAPWWRRIYGEHAPPPAGLFGACGEFGTGAARNSANSGAAVGRAAAARRAADACRPEGVPAPYPLAQAVAARVAEEAYNRGSGDNLGVVCIDLGAAAVEAAAEAAAAGGGGAAALVAGGGGGGAARGGAGSEMADGAGSCPVPQERGGGGAGGGARGGVTASEDQLVEPDEGRGTRARSGGDLHALLDLTVAEALAAAAARSELASSGGAASGGGGAASGACVLVQRTGGSDGGGGGSGDGLPVDRGEELLISGSLVPGGAAPPHAAGPGAALAPAQGAVALAGGVALVCRGSDRRYELTQHLVDAPVLPAHVHVWPLAKLGAAGAGQLTEGQGVAAAAWEPWWDPEGEAAPNAAAAASALACAPPPPAAPRPGPVCDERPERQCAAGGCAAGEPAVEAAAAAGPLVGGAAEGGACRFTGDGLSEDWVRRLAALPMQPEDWADTGGGGDDYEGESSDYGGGEGAEGAEATGNEEDGPHLHPPPPPPPRQQRGGALVEPFGALGGGEGGGPGGAAAAVVVTWHHAWASWARGGGGGGGRRALLGSDEPTTGGHPRGGGGGGGGGGALPLCIGCGEGRHAYHLGASSVGRGHFGEVWRAERRGNGAAGAGGGASGGAFVLKRVLGSRGPEVRRSGVREAYFGTLLRERARALRAEVDAAAAAGAARGGGGPDRPDRGGLSASELLEGHRHIVHFEESFKVAEDVWLVFGDAGQSLHSLMYEALGPAAPPPVPPRAGPAPRKGPSGGGGPEAAGAQEQQQRQQAAGLAVVGPSRWWLAARAGPAGGELVRSVARQALLALAAAHAAGAAHRDVKPENLLVRFERRPFDAAGGGGGGGALGGGGGDGGAPDVAGMHLRLIDWGSAADAASAARLYGRGGPGLGELTMEYAPPEVFFAGSRGAGAARAETGPARAAAYDVWSTGVVMLELVLGTPHVFALPPATRAALDRSLRLRGRPAAERAQLYALRGMLELCIYPPRKQPAGKGERKGVGRARGDAGAHTGGGAASGGGGGGGGGSGGGGGAFLVPWSCSDDSLLRLIASRDPTGRGLGGVLALRLLQRLLHWDPAQRPTAAQALRHAYFTSAAAEPGAEGGRSGAAGGGGGGGGSGGAAAGCSSLDLWLRSLITTSQAGSFFNPCPVHKDFRKSEATLFCVDCDANPVCRALCQHCVPSHAGHRTIQVRRYVYCDVVRASDISPFVDISSVQTYTINQAKVVFLNHRPHAKLLPPGAPDACAVCCRALREGCAYCSLDCKVTALVREGRLGPEAAGGPPAAAPAGCCAAAPAAPPAACGAGSSAGSEACGGDAAAACAAAAAACAAACVAAAAGACCGDAAAAAAAAAASVVPPVVPLMLPSTAAFAPALPPLPAPLAAAAGAASDESSDCCAFGGPAAAAAAAWASKRSSDSSCQSQLDWAGAGHACRRKKASPRRSPY
ncbi:MAG: hypothetical protein J3K34DRAFT_468469 [Monoraphidium minutum]|nr:MAG: hypothetical protein J3K34DRAFT_468469 [Monoraphidium minutum]